MLTMKIKIKNLTYIKDLAGIKTSDGKSVKPHLLYRSSNLSGLNAEELNKLYDANIRYVCDFRTEEEHEIKPELVDVDYIAYTHLPVVENPDNPAITKENRLKILKDIVYKKGGVKKYMKNFYALLVDNDKAIKSYQEFFKILLESKENEATVFHCTQGKDRTGVGLMLLLSALGSDKKVIIKQYLAYNKISWFFRFSVYLGMFLTKGVILANALNDILRAVRSYILTSFEVIETKYQGMQNYLHNIIGLTDKDIQTLRTKYLN